MPAPKFNRQPFMSADPRPVEVDEELNHAPLYHTEDGPITFRSLSFSIHDLSNALTGLETMLEDLPDHLDIGPQRLMIRLAVNHMNSIISDLLPYSDRKGRHYSYDRSTTPPSFSAYETQKEGAHA